MTHSVQDLHLYIQGIKQEEDIFAKAQLLHHLTKDLDVPIKTIAQELKLSSSYVCNVLRVLKLPELVRDGYYAQLISPTHLFIIARLHEPSEITALYEETLKNSLSTTAVEERVRGLLYNVKSSGETVSDSTRKELQEKAEQLHKNLRVKVIQSRIRAKVVFEIFGGLDVTTTTIEQLNKKLLNLTEDSQSPKKDTS